jgi:hypothetical protein
VATEALWTLRQSHRRPVLPTLTPQLQHLTVPSALHRPNLPALRRLVSMAMMA